MQVFNSFDIPANARGASVAMGNFDGVHLGHQSVIDLARRSNAPLGIISFEPHPRSYFSPDSPPFRLMNAAAKAHRLEKLGVEFLFDLPFDAVLSSLSAEEFVRVVLSEGLGVSHVVVGADFQFGKGREGNVKMLASLCKPHGIEVTIAPLVSGENGPYSSSAIRASLAAGQPGAAAKMLGHWHRIDGVVEQGDQRGRELGFPTANISVDNLHLPRFGVYAVFFDVLDGPHKGSYLGASSLGERPTFGRNIPNLEVHVLDFKGDLYGANVSVALVEFQRPELKFDGLESLIEQMKDDCVTSRSILEAVQNA
ncbi:MAG: bifunctional riboflavin kinase/FAD synthetase [Rhodobacteraceae bacterium]|nr:bifunctional riboflavin kinase/FAD synthetase [Paracoccaceae bacterium]